MTMPQSDLEVSRCGEEFKGELSEEPTIEDGNCG